MRAAALICSGLRHRAAPTARAAQVVQAAPVAQAAPAAQAAQAVQTAPAAQAAQGDAESTELHRSCARILISKQEIY